MKHGKHMTRARQTGEAARRIVTQAETPKPEPKPAEAPAAPMPGKVQQKATAREREARIFREAAERLGIVPAHDCRDFGCTRQTLASWIQGKTSAPREALVIMLAKSNEAARTRREVVKAEFEAMQERIAAGLEAAEKIRTRRNGD